MGILVLPRKEDKYHTNCKPMRVMNIFLMITNRLKINVEFKTANQKSTALKVCYTLEYNNVPLTA
jgi:hypothetical protein